MVDQEKEQGFKVTDRRGVRREDASTPQPEDSQPKNDTAPGQETQTEHAPQQDGSSPPLPEADFMTLIFSLYTHAQISLGLIPDPMTQQMGKDLVHAKYNIDILTILKEKTQGNLSEEEDQALEQMLYELHMNYVQIR